jgi:hypothetical protein
MLVFRTATSALAMAFLIATQAGFVYPWIARWVAWRGHFIR